MTPTALRVPIAEIFRTIQGEGSLAGTPAIFIRTQGCDVGCPWCDTKHTWPLKGEGGQWRQYTIQEVADEVKALQGGTPAPLVVITGGEPFLHPEAIKAITGEVGRLPGVALVQFETSGTYPIPRLPRDVRTHVVVSPKIMMPGGRPLYEETMAKADELKMVITNAADFSLLEGLIERFSELLDLLAQRRIYLQPNAEVLDAVKLCIDAVTNSSHYKLSLQTHKTLGIR